MRGRRTHVIRALPPSLVLAYAKNPDLEKNSGFMGGKRDGGKGGEGYTCCRGASFANLDIGLGVVDTNRSYALFFRRKRSYLFTEILRGREKGKQKKNICKGG